MIGSFWNLCRACPSMPVDKLHSEYRSTYRWHEYRSGAGAGAALGGDDHTSSAPAPTNNNAAAPPLPNNVVRRAPLPSQNGVGPRAPSIEPAMPRRKKYPGLAYKTNEIFEAAAAGLPSSMVRDNGGSYTLDRARSMERTKYLQSRGERRSKSEGPRNAQQANGPRTWTDTVEEKATSPSIAEKKRSGSEYRNQFAWPREDTATAGAGATSGAGSGGETAPRKSVSMGTLKAAQPGGAKRRIAEGGATELEPLMNHTDDDCDGKKFIEDYQKPGDGTQRKTARLRSAVASLRRATRTDDKQDSCKSRPPVSYKSEYKKKFRPFSHYLYEASKGTFTKCREPDPSVKEKMLPKAQSVAKVGAPQAIIDNSAKGPQPQPADSTVASKDGGDSWYREVLDLRKLAGEYKYRGWGTELAPDHLTEIYNKQMDLWYQVSRRSSLSALSLASTNHRAISKEEKDKENENKNRTSPKKPKSFRSAPHQSIHAKLQETRQQETPAQRSQRKKLQGHSFDNNSVSEGKGSASAGRSSARTSPRKQLNLVIGGRGSSVEPASGDFGPRTEYRSPKRRPRSADPKPHQPMGNGPLEDKRRPSKPSGLALNTSVKYSPTEATQYTSSTTRRSFHSALSASPKRKHVKPKVGITIDDDAIPLRSGSAFREHRLLDDTPVVKSPPEPTRVKSPEQMNMRSPDPVNWTVPLDTGKTFTVTQNVKSDDLIKRPGSDFKGGWGGDDHSASISATLDHGDSISVTKPSPQQELAPVHQGPSNYHLPKQDAPKSVEISQKPCVTNLKYAKTPTSPPNLTPIDEMKVLDVSKPIVNGGTSSSSDTHPSPVTTEVRLPGDKTRLEDPSFEMANLMAKSPDNFKPLEATQKSHGGVDTSVVSQGNPASVAAEVLEKARTRFDNFWGKKEGGNDSV